MSKETEKYVLVRLLIDEFTNIGMKRAFESLTLKEIENMSCNIVEKLDLKQKEIDEPPF